MERETLPKSIGPYKIESLLERGGTSNLYLATHPETDEPITVKALSSKYLRDPDAVSRFLNEAEIIAITDHPNIVKLYGYGEWKGGLYIAMEFIQGVTLRQYLMQNPLSLKRALSIILDIAYALCHLHTHGVIHRDLTPENILITQKGEVKVIDFGIAQLLTASPVQGKEEERFLGTPIYMSPEQQTLPSTVTYASDIYSFGIIAYELVTGRLSFGKIHLSMVPKGLHYILSKTLQPNPLDRYQDIVDVISDVSGYLNSSHFQKERRVGDQVSELAEGFQEIKNALMPTAPTWEGVQLGLETYRGVHLTGSFYDFITFPDGDYGIVMGKPQTENAKGIYETALVIGFFRGMKSLFQSGDRLESLLEKLNLYICESPLLSPYALQILKISPSQSRYSYISCGMGEFWEVKQSKVEPIHCDHPPVGSDRDASFQCVVGEWKLGTRLIMHNLIVNESEALMKTLVSHHLDYTPNVLGDLLFRRLTLAKESKNQDPSTLLVLAHS